MGALGNPTVGFTWTTQTRLNQSTDLVTQRDLLFIALCIEISYAEIRE